MKLFFHKPQLISNCEKHNSDLKGNSTSDIKTSAKPLMEKRIAARQAEIQAPYLAYG